MRAEQVRLERFDRPCPEERRTDQTWTYSNQVSNTDRRHKIDFYRERREQANIQVDEMSGADFARRKPPAD